MTEPDPGTGRQQLKCGIFFFFSPFQFTVSQYIVALALALAQVRIKTKANTFLPQPNPHPTAPQFTFANSLEQINSAACEVVAQVFLCSSEVVVDVFVGSGCRAQVFLGSSHSRLTPLFTSGGAESQFGQTVSALFPTIAPQLLLCSV